MKKRKTIFLLDSCDLAIIIAFVLMMGIAKVAIWLYYDAHFYF